MTDDISLHKVTPVIRKHATHALGVAEASIFFRNAHVLLSLFSHENYLQRDKW
jgi:hypothetical protein